MKITVALACLLLAAPRIAQAQPAFTPQPSIALPAELDRVMRDYERLWQASDAAGLSAIFTADGFVPTGRGWVRGSASIQSTYAGAGGPLRLRAHAYATADSVGYIVGSFRYGEAATAPDAGKFILALRREAGGPWRIAADLDGPNRQ